MKTKQTKSYINIFENLKTLLLENNIQIDFKKIIIMSDFEKALRNAIRICFPQSTLIGCYFHYLKAIYGKFKKYGLIQKKEFKYIYKILFIFKLYPFMYRNDQIEILKYVIDKFIVDGEKSRNKKMYAFILYFIKNWFGNDITNFLDLADNKLKLRTDNNIESFHNKMRIFINHTHQKFSYFIEKYKLLIQDYYNRYIDILRKGNNNEENNNDEFITKDIINFSLTLVETYKDTLGISIINNIKNEDELKLKDIIFKIFDLCFKDVDDLKNESEESSEDENDSDKIKEKEIEGKYKILDNSDITKIKEKLNDLAKRYYNNNLKDNIFNDIKLIEIANKR